MRTQSERRRRAGGFGAVVLAFVALSSPAWPAPRLPGQQNPPAEAPSRSEESQQQDERTYDPGEAAKDIEVGTFYMHKGNLDAAIARFEDAVRVQPNLGKARLLLAEAYEKKHERATALKWYKEYLRMFPNAPDAKKIRKKIDKLSAKSK